MGGEDDPIKFCHKQNLTPSFANSEPSQMLCLPRRFHNSSAYGGAGRRFKQGTRSMAIVYNRTVYSLCKKRLYTIKQQLLDNLNIQ